MPARASHLTRHTGLLFSPDPRAVHYERGSTWADALVLTYGSIASLGKLEVQSHNIAALVWWWQDEALLTYADKVVEINSRSACAWSMLGEVRCASFGKNPWEKARTRTWGDYATASKAYERAAEFAESEERKVRLKLRSQQCDSFANDAQLRSALLRGELVETFEEDAVITELD